MNRSQALFPLALAAAATLAMALPAYAAAGATAPAAAAVVIEVSGRATASGGSGPLVRLARLAAGEVVRTGAGASLKLAFASGLRYRLGEESSATVGQGDLTARSGRVEPLPRVPPFPQLPTIVDDHGLGIGGVRIRGGEITGVSPHCTRVLADAVRLAWEPPAQGLAYRVEVSDRQGEVVYRAEVAAPAAPIPAGTLAPGQTYSFTVETTDQPGGQARGRGRFSTLAADAAAGYAALRQALETEGEASSWALLAAVDRQLGLRGEEGADLRAALKLAPEDPGLTAALAENGAGPAPVAP